MIKDFTILLVEDSSMEVMKVRRAIDSLRRTHNIIEARNGELALEVLKGPDNLPNLILLDLNMPQMNGITFLETLKENDRLVDIPVVILSTSDCEQDISTCYKLGIAGFITKPTKYTDYLKKMKDLFEYCDVMDITKAS